MAKDDYADIAVTDDLVTAVSKGFADLMRDGFQEPERIAMDYQNAFAYGPGVCATHDYCDANMDMMQAFEDALVDASVAQARAHAFVTSSDDDATEAAQERRNGIWNAAWDMAKAEGFSYLKAQVSLEDLKALAPSLLQLPQNDWHHKNYPAPVTNALTEGDHAVTDLTDAIERSEVPAETLAAFAAAVRAGDDDRLNELLDEALGADRNLVQRW